MNSKDSEKQAQNPVKRNNFVILLIVAIIVTTTALISIFLTLEIYKDCNSLFKNECSAGEICSSRNICIIEPVEIRPDDITLETDTVLDYWPGAVIPFIIDADNTDEDLEFISQNIKNLDTGTINLVPRTDETDYIIFTQQGKDRPSCSSYLGKKGGGQPIFLTSICGSRGFRHELMHTLGFFHEHQRYDRDEYITIRPELIEDRTRRIVNYRISSNVLVSSILGDYDYDSVLHYASFVDSETNTYVITKKDGTLIDFDPEQEFSQGDLDKIERYKEISNLD